jgi:hypothetical protein
MLRRWDLRYGLVPLRLAAFLGQPIISYGHHQDCADGLGHLAEIADTVDSWGRTTWTDPESILRGHYRTKRDGELLHVEMCSRRVNAGIPRGVSWVVAHAPAGIDRAAATVYASLDGTTLTPYGLGVPIRVAGRASIEISIRSGSPVDPFKVSLPGLRIWAPVRRALTIIRDQVAPVVRTPSR